LLISDEETDSLRHEDSDADDDSSEDEDLSLAQSLISQSSDLSVNATKRNFSRLSVAVRFLTASSRQLLSSTSAIAMFFKNL
jgi:hypothetical protein